ncbi:MAG: beta-lactamase family protein [Victivallales bacterium]|nr:beta-lactamase family protein [Victivallales bacterium]
MNHQTINNQIQNILDQSVEAGEELGAQVTVYHNGEIIVDCWSGYSDQEKTREINGDTVFPVFSSGKAVASTAMHRLVEKGIIDYDTLVADVWPEFGCNGKEDVRLWHVMSHRTGLFECPAYKDAGELADWTLMCSRMAEAKPAWKPGTKCRYQSTTYTWLLGEIASRAAELPLSQIIQNEVIIPAQLDSLYFGTDDKAETRLATLLRGSDFDMAFPCSNGKSVDIMMNYEVVRKACLPGFNCITNARSLARHYAALVGMLDEVEPLLKPETLEMAVVLNRAKDDPVPFEVGTWDLFGLGYVLCGPKDNLGLIFGHGGLGGSEGLVDCSQNMVVAYTKNLLHTKQPTREKIYEALGIIYRDWMV